MNCEQKIDEQLQDRVGDFGHWFEFEELCNELMFDPDCGVEEVLDARQEEALDKDEARKLFDFMKDRDSGELVGPHEFDCLSVEKTVVYEVVLSTGGPHDQFDVFIKGGEIDRIDYVYKDWFDGARRTLWGRYFDVARDYLERALYLEELDQ